MPKTRTFWLVYVAVLVTFAVVIHTVEAAIPLPIPVPGAKLGLANIITLIALVLYGVHTALLVSVLRSVLGSFLIGNFLGFGFLLSISAAVVSTLAMGASMAAMRRGMITLVSVSIMGAVVHNMSQLAMASIIVESSMLFRGLFPLLILIALPTGFFTGVTAHYLLGIAYKVLNKAGLTRMDIPGGGGI